MTWVRSISVKAALQETFENGRWAKVSARMGAKLWVSHVEIGEINHPLIFERGDENYI